MYTFILTYLYKSRFCEILRIYVANVRYFVNCAGVKKKRENQWHTKFAK